LPKKIFIAYSIVILLLAVLPINNGNSLLNNIFILSIRGDYLVHFAIFIPWMAMVWIYFDIRFNKAPLKAFGWITAGIILGIVSEAIQYYVPYRAFNINDLVANVLGVILGSLFFFFKSPRINFEI
jgi:VanZ family protein